MNTTPGDEVSAGITVLIIDGDDMSELSCSLSRLAGETFNTAAICVRSESASDLGIAESRILWPVHAYESRAVGA